MNIIFSGIFWGMILVLLGLSMIIKIIFKVDIPIIRVVFAVILIYWGLKMLFGISLHHKSENSVIFDNADIEQVETGKEYNVIFGKSRIDLRQLEISDLRSKIEINVVFGYSEIYLNPEIPAKVYVDAVFAETKLPKGNVSFFGEYVYQTPAYHEGEDFLKIKLDVVFGNAIVKY